MNSIQKSLWGMAFVAALAVYMGAILVTDVNNTSDQVANVITAEATMPIAVPSVQAEPATTTPDAAAVSTSTPSASEATTSAE